MEVDTCKKGSVTEIFGFVSTEVREKDLLCIAIISHNSSRLQRKACCRMTKEKFLFFFLFSRKNYTSNPTAVKNEASIHILRSTVVRKFTTSHK